MLVGHIPSAIPTYEQAGPGKERLDTTYRARLTFNGWIVQCAGLTFKDRSSDNVQIRNKRQSNRSRHIIHYWVRLRVRNTCKAT